MRHAGGVATKIELEATNRIFLVLLNLIPSPKIFNVFPFFFFDINLNNETKIEKKYFQTFSIKNC